MYYQLPDFDKLLELAEKQPGELERVRIELCERVIAEAPEAYRRKLRGLQFRIDMERRKAKSPMAACIAISGMMHDSFDRLRHALNQASGHTSMSASTLSQETEAAKVLPFRKA